MTDRPDILAPNEIHVWPIELNGASYAIRSLEEHLCDDEVSRANRYHRPGDRRHYLVAHGVLRELLAGYTGKEPGEITFAQTGVGKPFLSMGRSALPIRFSLAHSGDYAVVAITLSAEIGIDIEKIDPSLRVEGLVERFFSPDEIIELRTIPPAERNSAFFSAWVRKEAYIKARGEGIINRLHQFTVAMSLEGMPLLLSDSLDPSACLLWRVHDLNIAAGYACALATKPEGKQINVFHDWKQHRRALSV